MAASLTDKFRKLIGFGGSTTLTSGITNAATSGAVNSFSGYPTDTATDLVIDRVDANGVATPSSREVMTVTVSSNTFTTDATRRALDSTSALAHNSAAVVENNFTAKQWNDHIDGHLAAHNQDGTIASSAVTTATIASSAVTTPKLKPTTNFAIGAGGGDHTTTATSLTDLVTILTYTAGATNERVFLDWSGCYSVSANAGLLIVVPSGTGVTNRFTSWARTASTTGTMAYLHTIFDVTAGSTATVKIRGQIITSGTLTLYDSNETAALLWWMKYVAYGNS